MKKTLALAAATLIAVFALPTFAQDASTGTEGAGTTEASTSTTADTANMSDTSYEAAVIAIETSAMVEFEPVDAADITIVRLSELVGDVATGNASLDKALAASAEVRNALHTSVGQNETLLSKLESEGGFTAEDVVAVRTKDDGSLVVYVEDREG